MQSNSKIIQYFVLFCLLISKNKLFKHFFASSVYNYNVEILKNDLKYTVTVKIIVLYIYFFILQFIIYCLFTIIVITFLKHSTPFYIHQESLKKYMMDENCRLKRFLIREFLELLSVQHLQRKKVAREEFVMPTYLSLSLSLDKKLRELSMRRF